MYGVVSKLVHGVMPNQLNHIDQGLTEFLKSPFYFNPGPIHSVGQMWTTEASGFGALSLYELMNASSTSKMEQNSSTDPTLEQSSH